MRNYNNIAIKKVLSDYKSAIWKTKRFSIFGLLLPAFGDIFAIYIPPLIIATVIKNFGENIIALSDFVPYILALGLAWLFGELLWRIGIYYLNKTAFMALNELYSNGMDELLKKDIGFFHDNFAGALTKRLIGYGRNFELFLDTITFNVVANIIPLIFVSIVLWTYSWVLVVFMLIMMLFAILLIRPLLIRRQKLVRTREEASNKLAGHIADVISNIDAVQSFANEQKENQRYRDLVLDFTKKARSSWDYHNMRIDLVVSPIYVLINVIGLMLAIHVSGSNATAALIFVVFSYFGSITRKLWGFNMIYRNLESSITDAAQFTELLIDKPEIKNIGNKDKINIPKGKIEFKNVSFKYKDAQEYIFKGLSLQIKPGERVAFVGHSGSGKTTITKLLLRFKETNDGQILIDDQDISHKSIFSLRQNIAYVPQDPAMFHRTITDNIAYGKLNASEEEIVTAALKSNAHEFIEKMPKGYDTYVGERGVKLSGGQRQRIAIARAMIKDAPILVLDEATSALDSISEGLIQEALWELMEGRTAIVIAHRLSTIQKMDRIIVIDNGRIIEDGSHKQLLEKNGEYAKLWKHQSGGFIKD